MTTTQIETKVLIPLDGPDQTLSETRIGVRWVRGVCRVGSGPVRLVPGFSTSGTRPKSGDMKWFFGGRKLDSTIINISLILSKSFYFPRLKCYIVQFLAYTHTLLLTWADAVEKIIINVHGFSVLQQKNVYHGDIAFLTKKIGDVVKKSWKNQGVVEFGGYLARPTWQWHTTMSAAVRALKASWRRHVTPSRLRHARTSYTALNLTEHVYVCSSKSFRLVVLVLYFCEAIAAYGEASAYT